MSRLSSTYVKIITFFMIFLLLSLVLTPSSTTTVKAEEDDGTGVGVLPVRPRITEVELEHNLATHHLRFKIFDLNSWRHVSEVSVQFYRGSELIRHYVFNQTEDLERSVEVRKGDGLVDFESHSSEETETVEQRCTLKLHFQFSGINYDRLVITATDHAGGTSESSIDFHGVTTGRQITYYLLPLLLLAAGAMVYRTVKATGGEIDE